MRKTKKLLEIVIDSLKIGIKIGWYNSGLCGEIDDLAYERILSNSERNHLLDIIKRNEPSSDKHQEFFEPHGQWFWPKMKDNPSYRQVRINFLIYLQGIYEND